jgi:hypothetical protein
MPSAKKSKCKSRNNSTFKTKCRFCREKCVGENVCGKCKYNNPHYKLEQLEESMAKGKINEGEYLAECKKLKEERDLEELAKEITTFDIDDSTDDTEMIMVPQEIVSRGMGAVVDFAHNLRMEERSMGRFMNRLEDMEGRVIRRENAIGVLERVARLIMDLIEAIYGPSTLDVGETDPTNVNWNDWLENSYNNSFERSSTSYQEDILSRGFSRTLNDEIDFCFTLEKQRDTATQTPRESIIIRVLATIYSEEIESYEATCIGKVVWRLGGDYEWGSIAH